jgi:hypothetical protein
MIKQPKPFSNNLLDGYALNKVEYRQSAIIRHLNIKIQSKINGNDIYNMINGVTSTVSLLILMY